MKDYLSSLLRHAFTALAGLGGFLASKGLLDPGDVSAVDAAGVSLGNALVVILAALLGRLLITLTTKFFRDGSGEIGDGTRGSGGGLGLWIIGAMAVLGGLPSCSPGFVENFAGASPRIPIRIGIEGPDAVVSYSSKGGLQVDYRSAK